MKEKRLYTFGEFTLNAEDHALSRNDENIPLTPKMFDLLLVLVQNPRRILTKEFLLQSVWPDSFVEEGNITFNVRQLRKALGDDAQSPTYIETIPRRGYRFLPLVDSFTTITPDKDEDSISEPAPIEPPVPSRTRNYLFLGAGVALILIGAIAIAGWILKKQASSSAPVLSAPFKLEKLSTDGGVFHVVISPDAKNIVYTHRMSGKQSLWLRQLENSNNVLIIPASDDFYGGLAISPDGNNVYFARGTNLDPQLNVYRMPIVGGVPQKVIEATQGWISLSPNGQKISYVRCPYTDAEWCSLYIADSADGKNEKKLVTRPRPMRIADNKFSPDGRFVAFAVGQSRTSSNEFMPAVVNVETGEERQLSSEKFFNINYFTWLPDQSSLLMTALQLPDSHFRIWKVSATTGETQKLTADSETYSRLSLDASGSILVSTQVEPDFRMTVFQTDNPTATPNVFGDANTVEFAVDGRLYFSSGRTGDFEVWSVNGDGSDLKQLTNDPSSDSVPVVSADGRQIFFVSDRTGVGQIWRMNSDGTNQEQLTKEEGGVPVRISPDSAWLYYRSALKNNLRRVSLESGQEEVVVQEMGRGLTVSPDTTRIAFSQRRGMESILTLASMADQSVIKTWRVTGTPNIVHLVWSNDGQSLAYVAMDDTRQKAGLWFQPVNEDKPRQVADLSGDEIGELQSFALSHDGKRFAVVKGSWKHDAVLLRGLK